ncbi:MAG: hypothetical protein Q8L48_43725 [Archangium sp.]|nr:hypothetical protein [Archangium sp.]
MIPVGHAANLPLQMYVGIDGVWDTEVDYALGDGYPASLTITPPNEIYVIQGCSTPRGTTAWTTLANVQGTAATLSLRSGVLSVSLNTEGTVTAVLEGEATGISCNGVTTLPLHHTLTIRVRRITGFVVDQVHQRWPGCEAGVVLPEGVALWLPVAHPLDASGNRFEAANAPKPVAMTLKSTGELARTMQSWELTASAGHVDLSLDTTRPVRGLASFEVVGAEALTRVEAKLFLRKAAWKGYVSEEITEGASYQLWFPEQDNLVDLQVTSALSSAGKLCMPIPGRWLTATSSTPHCGPAGGEQYGGGLPVAEIQSLGECRLEVTMPNTSHRWAASFTTR